MISPRSPIPVESRNQTPKISGPSLSTWVFYVIAVIVLLVAYLILLSTWINAKINPTLETKDYLFLVQVTLTFLATVGVGVLSVANARSTTVLQAQLSIETERLKADLLTGVNNKTEELKAQLTRETDYLKTRLSEIIPKEHDAYHSMWKAADAYFRALQNLEVGEFSEEKLTKADEYSGDALGKALLAKNEDCDAYYGFLGEVDVLRESASKHRGDDKELQKLWKDNYKKFGASYTALKEKLSARLRGP
jgi:hypothetical protein